MEGFAPFGHLRRAKGRLEFKLEFVIGFGIFLFWEKLRMLQKTNESGFSYIDVMIALVILMVGILASAAALTANLVRSFETEKQVVAKQIALSTIESIF